MSRAEEQRDKALRYKREREEELRAFVADTQQRMQKDYDLVRSLLVRCVLAGPLHLPAGLHDHSSATTREGRIPIS